MQLSSCARQASWGNNVNLTTCSLKLRSACGPEVEHFGKTSVRKQLGNQAHEISFEVAGDGGPIASSLSWLEGAGWTFKSTRVGWRLRGQEEIEDLAMRWHLLGSSGRCQECRDSIETLPIHSRRRPTQVRSQKIPVFLGEGTRSTHRMTHFLSSQLIGPLRQRFCYGGSSPPPRQEQDDGSRSTACLHVLGTTVGQNSTEANSMLTILDAVCIVTVMQKGMDEHATATVVSFLEKLECQRVLLGSDIEPLCHGTLSATTRQRLDGHRRHPTWPLAK